MKKDQLFEITEHISEDYIAEAMPRSLRDAHKSQDTVRMNKEKSTMKLNIAHYIMTGFASAAAIGIVVGCGVFITRINSRNPQNPGTPGSSLEPIVTEITEVTDVTGTIPTATVISGTSQDATATETVTETTAETTALTETQAANNMQSAGYVRNFIENDHLAYCFKNGKLSLDEFDAHVITDGQYAYQTEGYSLYRMDNHALIFNVDTAAGFIDNPENLNVDFYFTGITPAGNDWYFITAQFGTYGEMIGGSPFYQSTAQAAWWVNPKMQNTDARTKAADFITLPVNPQRPDADTALMPQYMQADPDGNAVYGYSMYAEMLYRIPTPGHGEVQSFACSLTLGQNYHCLFTPVSGGNLLYLRGYAKNGEYHTALESVNMASGTVSSLGDRDDLYEIYQQGGRVWCLVTDGSELLEYLPASNSSRTVARFDECLNKLTAIWDDQAIINGQLTDGPETVAIHVTSLTNGTYEYLQ